MLPRWVRSLDDYWSWFAEQLDYSGGRLVDESVQVQIVEDAATGERLALILGRQRIVFPGGSWLEFRVVVDRFLEQVEYNYHYSSAEGRSYGGWTSTQGTGSCRTSTALASAPTPIQRST